MIYLDNAATSFPKAPGVAEEVARAIREIPGSAGRASHEGARAASEVLFYARREAAEFFGIPQNEEERLIFTKSATESINLAICGLVPPHGRVAVSDLEHNAVMRPLRFLEEKAGLRIMVFHCDRDGRPDQREVQKALGSRPDLVILSAASNVTGALPPVAELAEILSVVGPQPPLLIDASQYVGHFEIPRSCLKHSLVAFSAHKGLLGPGGVGFLWLPPGITPEPLIRGGTGSASESEKQPGFLPDRYEAGTHNIAALAGLRAAVAYLKKETIAKIAAKEEALTQRLYNGLLALPGLTVSGPAPGVRRAPLVSFVVDGVDSAELALDLDRRGIACRVGLHCAPAAHRSAGTYALGGSIRLSPGCFNTEDEIDMTISTIKELL